MLLKMMKAMECSCICYAKGSWNTCIFSSVIPPHFMVSPHETDEQAKLLKSMVVCAKQQGRILTNEGPKGFPSLLNANTSLRLLPLVRFVRAEKQKRKPETSDSESHRAIWFHCSHIHCVSVHGLWLQSSSALWPARSTLWPTHVCPRIWASSV